MKTFERLKSIINALPASVMTEENKQVENVSSSCISLNNIEMLANTIELEIDSIQYEEK